MTDDAPRAEVEHHREVQPALAGATVCHVRGPDAVGCVDGEVPVQEIGRDRQGRVGPRCHDEARLRRVIEPELTHQAGDASPTDEALLVTQVAHDPRAAVIAIAPFVGRGDPQPQGRIRLRVRTGAPMLPDVERRARDAQHAAHQG